MDDNTFAEEPTLASEDFFFPESDDDDDEEEEEEEEEEYSYHLNRPHAQQQQQQHKNNMMHTGSKAIDEIFAGRNTNGGGEFGLLHYITTSRTEEEEENSRRGGGGGGARDLSLAILAAHLLRAPDSTAMVIEWTLSSASSLDVRRLQRILQVSDSSRGEGDGGGASERIMEVLGRLNISKVFDAVGLDEALMELGGTLDTAREQQQQQSVRLKGSNTVAAAAQEGNKTATIGDSEDDDDEDDLEKENPEKDKAKQAPISTASKSPPATLLLINSISQILTPIIRNNYIQGQALLTSLMRSIADLTKRHQLFTIVLGEAGFRSVAEDETLSAFKSCVMKPAVGYGIGFLVDVHFYLHRPFVGADSQKKMMKKKGEGPAGAQSQDRNEVSVLEIVEDRRGDRYQSYAPFHFTPDGRLQDVLQDS
ncbi:hypothetical protein SMMN14_01096 [Sphaerulina musiva]